MRKLVEEPHLLDEFMREQSAYSPDFKALVIKLLDQHQNVEQVAQLTNVPTRTLYNWLNDWNQLKKSPQQPIS